MTECEFCGGEFDPAESDADDYPERYCSYAHEMNAKEDGSFRE